MKFKQTVWKKQSLETPKDRLKLHIGSSSGESKIQKSFHIQQCKCTKWPQENCTVCTDNRGRDLCRKEKKKKEVEHH